MREMLRSVVKRSVAKPSLIRRLISRSRAEVVVLMYHDLRDDDDFSNWTRVGVSAFAEQLRFLGDCGEFVGPEALERPEQLESGRLYFVVTFDDGYLNNSRLALPVLEKLGVPALFFISTGQMLNQQPFWPDLVVTPIQALDLEILDLTEFGFGVFRFRRGNEVRRWQDIERLLVTIKNTGDEDDPQVAAVLRRFRHDYADVLSRNLPRFRPLNQEELVGMVGSRCCYIGSHGHDHRLLTRLPADELSHSLGESRRLLEEHCERAVTHFAYPNGDRDRRVATAVADAGYKYAYTVEPGVFHETADSSAVRRIGVSGCGGSWLLGYQLVQVLLGERKAGLRRG